MRNEIWGSMLDADMNFRYWKQMCLRYKNYEWWIKLFLAVTTSGTVAGWGVWNDFPLVWKILSGISALTSIVVSTLKWPDLIGSLSSQSTQWWELCKTYSRLWNKINSGVPEKDLEKTFEATKDKEGLAVKEEIKLPHDKELLNLCYQEVLVSRGLS